MTRIIHSITEIDENNFLINYEPKIDPKLCKDHGLDYNKVLEKEYKKNTENIEKFNHVSIATAAMVTSYSKIYMNKFKLEIIKNGGKIYYSDTDSLVIDKNSLNLNWIGKEIGKFKIEHYIKEGYFISNKTYCLVTEEKDKNGNDLIIIKAKGVSNTKLNLEDFKNMYFYKNDIETIKKHTTTNYKKGTVNIENKKVILKFDSYKKRTKIFNNQNLWINTEPIFKGSDKAY